MTNKCLKTGADKERINNKSFPKVVVGNLSLYKRQQQTPDYDTRGKVKEDALNKGSFRAPLRSGFTLIELLVVVLIIGILASVALPQYNKAVRKARLSEVATTFNSISKGIDAWLLENGGFGSAQFSGTSKTVTLDIAQTCAAEDSEGCYTKTGKWSYWCDSSMCSLWLSTSYNTDKTTGNEWLSGQGIGWYLYPNSQWSLAGGININGVNAATADICRWWKDLYGADRIIESAVSPCAPYL